MIEVLKALIYIELNNQDNRVAQFFSDKKISKYYESNKSDED